MLQVSGLQKQAAESLTHYRYSEAIALYEQGIQADPRVMSNYWFLGLALLLNGQEPEAQATWLSALAKGNSEETEIWVEELVGILLTAAQHYETVPDLKVAWLIRQYIREFAPGHLNNILAIILLDIELKDFSTYTQLALLQATQLLISNELTDVDSDLLLQIAKKLSNINPYHEFLLAYLKSENLVHDSQESLQLKNKLALAYNSLGVALYQQENFNQAVNSLYEALELGANLDKTNLTVIRFNAGRALEGQGDFAQAAKFFQAVLEIEPDFQAARYQLARTSYKAQTILKGYQFSQDWFSRNILIWEEYLKPLAGTPNFNALEIGSWEGRATCWLLENILTHSSAKITCIDTFEGGGGTDLGNADSKESLESRFDFNIATTGGPEKVNKIAGKSEEELRLLPLNSYDLVYVDGSHLASNVLEDTVLSWGLVKVGGLIIFDDYDHHFPDKPEQNTKIGIDAFRMAFSSKTNLIHQSHQVILQKTAP